MLESQFYTRMVMNILLGVMFFIVMKKMALRNNAELEPKKHWVLKVIGTLFVLLSIMSGVFCIMAYSEVFFPAEMLEPALSANSIAHSSDTIQIWGAPTPEQQRILSLELSVLTYLSIAAYFFYFKSSNSKWWVKILKFVLVIFMYMLLPSTTKIVYFDRWDFMPLTLFLITWCIAMWGVKEKDINSSLNDETEASNNIEEIEVQNIESQYSIEDFIPKNTSSSKADIVSLIDKTSSETNQYCVNKKNKNNTPAIFKKRHLLWLVVPLCCFIALYISSSIQIDDHYKLKSHYNQITYGLDLKWSPDYRYFLRRDTTYIETIGKKAIGIFTWNYGKGKNEDREVYCRVEINIIDISDDIFDYSEECYGALIDEPVNAQKNYTTSKPKMVISYDGTHYISQWVFYRDWAYRIEIESQRPEEYEVFDIREKVIKILHFSSYDDYHPTFSNVEYKAIYLSLVILLSFLFLCFYWVYWVRWRHLVLNKPAMFTSWWLLLGIVSWLLTLSLTDLVWDYTSVISEVVEHDYLSSSYSVKGYLYSALFVYVIGMLLLVSVMKKQFNPFKEDYLLCDWMKDILLFYSDSPRLRRLAVLLVMWPAYYLLPIPLVGLVVTFYLGFIMGIFLIVAGFFWVKDGYK